MAVSTTITFFVSAIFQIYWSFFFSYLKFLTASARSSPSGQKTFNMLATRDADIPLCP